MKQLVIVIIVLALFLTHVTHASAHLLGQPSFFTINGKYTDLYPVQSTSISTFEMPQDIAPETYLVNTSLVMELDPTRIGVPVEIINKSTFDWNYGDGTSHGTGLKNTHVYEKIGSYVSKIYVTSPDSPEPQLLQSEMIHILPNASYKLPVSRIIVNGKTSKDPMNDILKENFSGNIFFDGSTSTALSSKITSYYWDYGDETSSTKPSESHQLPVKYYMAFPVLRITDANGFISDSFVQINNDKKLPIKHTSKVFFPKRNTLIYIVLGTIVFFIGLTIVLKLRRRR